MQDNAQLIIWIRIVDDNLRYFDEIFDLQLLKGTTKGVDIFEALKKSLDAFEISFKQITAITTDGAAAMTGNKSGLIALIRKENPLIHSFHCIIHQESLVAKLGIKSAKPMADKVMSIVNKLISGGALKHRQFRNMLEETNAALPDISKMQQVRWLSCQKVFNEFLQIIDQIKDYVNEQQLDIPELQDQIWVNDLAFFSDLTTHFRRLNLQLQGIFYIYLSINY